MLDVRNLCVDVRLHGENYPVLENVYFTVQNGESLGLVGESGCGKSITAASILGLLRPNVHISRGVIDWNGRDLSRIRPKDYQSLRGRELSMIFQDSLSSLNPLMRVGKQLSEAYQIHTPLRGEALRRACLEALEQVGFIDPEATMKRFPHQLSGGQRQRIVIAMAIAAGPQLLLADEPTTALDIITQKKILALLKSIQKQKNMSLVLISHDIGIIGEHCERVAVMYSGWTVECGSVDEIMRDPLHPYTRALIQSMPGTHDKNSPLPTIEGRVPSLTERPKRGCMFYERCPKRCAACRGEIPVIRLESGRRVKCVLYAEGGESRG